MATIKLTDTTWLEQESAKVAGILKAQLGGSAGKDGIPQADLKKAIERALPDGYYTTADLVIIRTKLIADGVIEVV